MQYESQYLQNFCQTVTPKRDTYRKDLDEE